MKSASPEKNEVQIPSGEATINGNLEVPKGAQGIVVFAHGSGSSRFSSRNTYVAGLMNKKEIATLLIDLLTADEDAVDDSEGLSWEEMDRRAFEDDKKNAEKR